jgi:hypothetical protein
MTVTATAEYVSIWLLNHKAAAKLMQKYEIHWVLVVEVKENEDAQLPLSD